MAMRSTNFVEAILDSINIFQYSIEELKLIHNTIGASFLASSIVRK